MSGHSSSGPDGPETGAEVGSSSQLSATPPHHHHQNTTRHRSTSDSQEKSLSEETWRNEQESAEARHQHEMEALMKKPQQNRRTALEEAHQEKSLLEEKWRNKQESVEARHQHEKEALMKEQQNPSTAQEAAHQEKSLLEEKWRNEQESAEARHQHEMEALMKDQQNPSTALEAAHQLLTAHTTLREYNDMAECGPVMEEGNLAPVDRVLVKSKTNTMSSSLPSTYDKECQPENTPDDGHLKQRIDGLQANNEQLERTLKKEPKNTTKYDAISEPDIKLRYLQLIEVNKKYEVALQNNRLYIKNLKEKLEQNNELLDRLFKFVHKLRLEAEDWKLEATKQHEATKRLDESNKQLTKQTADSDKCIEICKKSAEHLTEVIKMHATQINEQRQRYEVKLQELQTALNCSEGKVKQLDVEKRKLEERLSSLDQYLQKYITKFHQGYQFTNKSQVLEFMQQIRKHSNFNVHVTPVDPRQRPPLVEKMRGPNPILYPMLSSTKGKCIIINIVNYTKQDIPTRRGSEEDEWRLKALFTQIGFLVESYRDLKHEEVVYVLERAQQERGDSFVLAFLTHGTNGTVVAADGRMLHIEKDIKKRICRVLPGKPKLAIIVACRTDGESLEDERQRFPESDFKETLVHATDLITFYSTVPSCPSSRNPQLGTPFIQTFVDIVQEHCHDTEMRKLTRMVRDCLYTEKGIVAPDECTDTKEWYLLPKDDDMLATYRSSSVALPLPVQESTRPSAYLVPRTLVPRTLVPRTLVPRTRFPNPADKPRHFAYK